MVRLLRRWEALAAHASMKGPSRRRGNSTTVVFMGMLL
ncbi:Hypothetical protein PFR_JS23_1896 [Propionibacterium freudenreichii]|uniref:Uncharacterized protein n=2 Tax=Propionibacterium freudenreichii TaxID=1744 RepID=D7GIH7_PROFC|nr:Hypothetical protein PFREUD_03650 [Propionibacterium freudenreichii subsp. shermanii CIRM-BIA1]SCQ62596.1 Hypothetical protein PFR_JS15-1_367 [Propionibacterium freudenreichii]SCQ72122.1 Hypothetical protein PFR_JS15-2_370 [Propionibacterium freudenreichii]SCQ81295.1 Hypothetical protein PFR_JS23_1896 [Propionibacterium freudenreichii]